MAFALDLIVQPRLAPRESLAADRVLLERLRRASSPARGVLRVHGLAGDVLALGRYHVAPAATDSGVTLWRRYGGGRVVPAGDGFVGVSLLLPHRSALVGTDASALTPEQVLNRCVRGVLGACERAGIPALYPGRDTITVRRRTIGVISLEVDGEGGCVVEVVLAVGRDFALLPQLLERADPRGAVAAAMVTAADVTSVGGELGAVPDLRQVAEWLGEGFPARLGVEVVQGELTVEEQRAIADRAARDFGEGWLRSRARRGDRRGSIATQLGVLEASFARRDERVHDVTLIGDFIASSPAIARLEEALEGCRADPDAIGSVVDAVLGEPGNFVLGIGPISTIVEAFRRGLAT